MNPADLLLVGVTQGCIYGLIAMGFVLIYKSSEMINFAQGDLAVLGAFLCMTFMDSGLGFGGAFGISILVMFALAILLEIFLIRKLHGHPHFTVVILTIALGLVLRAIIGIVWGYEPRSVTLPIPSHISVFGDSWELGPMVLVSSTVLLCVLLGLFFKTKWGLALKAASQNQLAAYYVGIPVRGLYSLSWGIAAIVATVAGILLASNVMIDPHTGFIGIKAFAAAVIGGLGSLPGAMIGGIVVGIVEQFAGSFLPAGSQEIAAYVMMLLILLIKPHGLISQIQLKKA